MRPVVVYGGGVAALATALELLERGLAVDLVGPCEPARSSELAVGGIQLGDDGEQLQRDLIDCGGTDATAAIRALARAAPSTDEWLGRCGIPFASKGGERQWRKLEGSSVASAAFVESVSAAQIAWALDRRLSAHESGSKPALHRFDPYHLVELTRNADGHVSGIVAQHLVSMDFELFDGAAVVLASAGCGRLHGSASQLLGEAAVAVAARAGALLAGLDRMQLHPAALSRGRQRLVLSSALRAEGGRFWVPVDNREARRGDAVSKDDRDFFLEEAYPDAGSLAADDLAARAVRRICDEERGVYDRQARRNQPLVYLDLTHLPEGHLAPRVGSEIDAIAKLTGTNGYQEPIAVSATWSGSLGGLWVDQQDGDDDPLLDPSPRNHATSLAGLYAVGDVACLYHGGCRLGGARLLADLFGSRAAAAAVTTYAESHSPNDDDEASEQALERAVDRYRKLTDSSGEEPAQALADGLADAMDQLAFGGGDADELLAAVRDLRSHLAEAAGDPSELANRGAVSLRGLDDALLVAEAAARSTVERRRRGDPAPLVRCQLDGDGQIEVVDDGTDESPKEDA